MFTLNISYTMDNWALPQIDENTKIHWLFPRNGAERASGD